MKHIQLTGIGNALVDVEYSITEDELVSFGVGKGTMTLTDPDRQQEILSTLKNHEPQQSSGGSVANSIIAFAQFGGKAGFMSVLGNDALGNFYASEFHHLNIELRADTLNDETTGSCIVLITPDGERTMNTSLAANLAYRSAMVDKEVIKHSEWIFLEGYKLTEDDGAEALDLAAFTAKRNGTYVAVSCSDKFIVDVYGDQLQSILQKADMVFCNEAEGNALAQETTIEETFRALHSRYGNIAFTQGTGGSRIHWFGKETQVPAYPAETIDTTGAGDMYAGAFLYAALKRYPLELAARLASFSSAQVVSQFGARLKADHIEVRNSVLTNSQVVD